MKTLKVFLTLFVAVLLISCNRDTANLVDSNDEITNSNGKSGLIQSGATLLVPSQYSTIQEAVDAANDGDIIKVSSGTYYEQVEVRDLDDLQLVGDDATITVPKDGMTGQLLKVFNCENIHIKGFTIDGDNGDGVSYGAKSSGGDADTRFCGIFTINTSGKIENNFIKDVSWHNGVQEGLGMYVLVNDNTEREINISDNEVTNFQKNGITVWGPIKATIHRNVVEGWGDTKVIAQNCIQLGGSSTMTASVKGNTISKSNYTPFTWASTGILALNGNNNIRIVNNTISSCMIGIYVYPGSTNCKIINNKGSNNTWDYYSYEDDTKTHANKFE